MRMEVMIFNQIRTLRCDGVACALLRDNVQHYLENGVPSGKYWAIHALADTRWTRAAETLNPQMLASELDTVWPCLRDLPIESLAISIRTRAVLTNCPVPPEVRGTCLHRLTRWPVPFDFTGLVTLGDLLGRLVADLSRLVREAHPNAGLVMRSVVTADSPPPTEPNAHFHADNFEQSAALTRGPASDGRV